MLDDVHLYLRKSQNALLNIMCVSFHGEGAEFMEIVAPAVHRCKSTVLSSTTGKDLVRQLQGSMPELTDLQITVRNLFDLPEEDILQLHDLPKFKQLRLYNVGLQWGNVRLERLRSLQLANLEATAPTLGQVLAIIQSPPDLKQLALSNIRITIDGIPPLQNGSV
ncbi:hypothetical protein M407DRAFT_21283 [Tulasnella calospora MUT 4182]|uniref:Uncharacterized protein n=1 Tax=Tulasnella calospora MUT 4182 TaxID=1051891 RepID=A0A0C3QQ09_9AGAM|nr:hypothetical protein M407DRAFT_21283 [Tulasnella calospora MUT 4182]